MEKILKEELLAFFEKYTQQKADEVQGKYDDESYEHCFEYQLLGVSKAVKSIAHKIDNMELLGLAAKIEIDVLLDIQNETSARNEYQELLRNEIEFEEKARQFCIQLFFKENRYKADMTRYAKIIDEHKEAFESLGLLDTIKRYFDEEKVLSKIYSNVRDWVAFNDQQSLPEKTEVDKKFYSELKEIYRKADSYINNQLIKTNQLIS